VNTVLIVKSAAVWDVKPRGLCYLNHNGRWSEDLENGASAFLRNVDKYLSDHMSYLRSVMYIHGLVNTKAYGNVQSCII
jgi:hypothetical protein